jgi:hypothetical protein
MKSNSKLSIMSAAAILSLGAGEANARDVEPLVYYTGFEAPTYKLGALGHQDEWRVEPPDASKIGAMVESDLIGSGTQAVRLDASVLGGGDTEWIRPINYALDPTLPVLEFSWDMLLEPGKLNSMAWQFSVYSIPSRAIAMLYVQGDKDEVWFRTDGNPPVKSGAFVKRSAWNRFAIRVDHSRGTVEYFVNGVSVAGENAAEVALTTNDAAAYPAATAHAIKPALATDVAMKPELVAASAAKLTLATAKAAELPAFATSDLASPGPLPKIAIAEIGIRVMGPGSDSAVIDSIAIRPSEEQVCRANCDHSKARPLLNANDFQCFLNEFDKALGLPVKEQIRSYANFDRSQAEPVLNINDFIAFMSAYAAGCP